MLVLLTWTLFFPFCASSSNEKIQLKTLAEEMQAVSKGLEKVEQELAASENDGAISSGFQRVRDNDYVIDFKYWPFSFLLIGYYFFGICL